MTETKTMTLAEFGTGELLWSMLWFTLFFIWIWILISCVMDIFRDCLLYTSDAADE